MMDEAISMALKGRTDDSLVDFAHKSVVEASKLWAAFRFSDLDAPYFMVNDDVKLNGRGWRAASVESVISILNESGLRL